MGEWYASGRMVEIIFALMLLEGAALIVWRRIAGSGIPTLDLIVNFAAGGFLLLALRSALVRDEWTMIALWLTGALVAHVVDLRRRWRAD